MASKISTTESRTIFVKNIPFTLSGEEFEKLFYAYGPIRQAFIVKDASGKSRGFGYIKFGLRDDAVKATRDVIMVDGRQLHVSFAKKALDKTEPKVTPELEKPAVGNSVVPDSVGSVVSRLVSVLKSESETELWLYLVLRLQNSTERHRFDSQFTVDVLGKTIARKVVGDFSSIVKTIQYPLPTGESSLPATLRQDKDNAVALIEVYHRHFAPRLAKRLTDDNFDGFAVQCIQWPRYKSYLKLHAATSAGKLIATQNQGEDVIKRLIVRNLPFKMTEEQLRTKFKRYGSLSEVSLVTRTVGDKTTPAGFAFITYETRESAEKALAEMNGEKVLKREIAVDWTIDRRRYVETLAKNAVGQPKAAPTSKATEDSDDDEEDDESEGQPAKNILSEGHSSDSDEGDESGDNEDTCEKKKLNFKDAADKRTLFVRNIPFDAAEDQIAEIFEKYGRVLYCRICLNKATGLSTGSAFIKFQRWDAAKACLAAFDKTPGAFELLGRALSVLLATSRDQLPANEGKNSKKEIKKMEAVLDVDSLIAGKSRNLHLADEGVILPGSPLASEISKTDLQRRVKLEQIKRAKLKDPNVFVSPVRLSVHNIPKRLTHSELREVFMDAALTVQMPEDGEMESLPNVVITEARIMRDKSRIDQSKVGESTLSRRKLKFHEDEHVSLGYGFVTFEKHTDALAALCYLNNNPEYYSQDKRLIVQFSLESRKALELRLKRKTKSKQVKKVDVPIKSDTKKIAIQRKKIRANALKMSMESQVKKVKSKPPQPTVSREKIEKKRKRKIKNKTELHDGFDDMIADYERRQNKAPRV